METPKTPELITAWFVVANHVQRGFIREGARCYIAHDTALGRVQVLVAPKGRRWAAFWTTPKRLIVEEVVRVGSKLHRARMPSRERAEREVERLVRQGARRQTHR